MEADFTLADHGTILILTPHSELAHEFVADRLPEDALRWAGGIAVDHRCIGDILAGIRSEGLTFDD